ncbi:MAG TPA: RcnB family protein [Arsenicitalea sp.]|jgi:Ni/Co efflux regulator RcnB|nr:RcnB family protein [Arsenicitalea sp.]
MKRLLLASVAISLMATPMAFAAGPIYPNNDPHHQHQQQPQPKPHWQMGHRFPAGTHYTAVSDYRHYHLRTPPRGQHWVRVNNEYVLVGITTGIISSILSGH